MLRHDASDENAEAQEPELQVIVIGAGFGGVGMGVALKRAGIDRFLILEKAADVGGVWRDNQYPGAACDVPSHLYSFSFEPKADWSRVFAPQAEIHAYLRHCAHRHGLMPHLRFRAEVRQARFDDARHLWAVHLADGQTLHARVLVSGTGQLSLPVVPELDGLPEFKGHCFHSAHWNHGLPLKGKRVAVVGTGASAIQFIPAIAPEVSGLHVFQRSAAYVLPRPDRAYSRLEKAVFKHVPGAMAALRAWIYLKYESRALAFLHWQWLMKPAGLWPFERMLKAQVPDDALRHRLMPDYPIGCKRILLSSDYLRTLSLPHVQVHTQGIRRVRPEGIETNDGQVHEADVILFGTGFAATEFLAPMRIVGSQGRELSEAWRNGASAYLGLSVPGFPNFFMLYGPNTNLGHNSIVYMIESQIAHVMRCLKRMDAAAACRIEVKPEHHEAHVRWVQKALSGTVWKGCRSWYVDARGHNPTNWPGFTFTYRWRTGWAGLGAYRVR